MATHKYPIFLEFYDRILSARTSDEALKYCAEALERTDNEIEMELINSLVDKTRFVKHIAHDKFRAYVDLIINIMYYNDAVRLCNEIKTWTLDRAQINTINRILKMKEHLYTIHAMDLNVNERYVKIYKKCPHCKTRYVGDEFTNYVVCGYNPHSGFDWNGCGRDWCFTCEKKLCKCWNVNQLFNIQNRHHNAKCCKKYAAKTDCVYPEDFCQCQTEYVERGRV